MITLKMKMRTIKKGRERRRRSRRASKLALLLAAALLVFNRERRLPYVKHLRRPGLPPLRKRC